MIGLFLRRLYIGVLLRQSLEEHSPRVMFLLLPMSAGTLLTLLSDAVEGFRGGNEGSGFWIGCAGPATLTS